MAALKSIKNATELEGFRQSHIRDGAALARYFSWLEEALNEGKEVNEWEGAEVLEGFRKELDLFKGLSFTTISGTGPNGGAYLNLCLCVCAEETSTTAIIHYSPDPKDCAIIKKDQVCCLRLGSLTEALPTRCRSTYATLVPSSSMVRPT